MQTVKRIWAALDSIKELLTLNREGPLGGMVRDLKECATGLLTKMLHAGGYFVVVEQGFSVDSTELLECNHDDIACDGDGDVSVGTVIEHDPDYLAPVYDHFSNNDLPTGMDKAYDLIGGCALYDPEKVVYIDELDPEDSTHKRLERVREYRSGNLLQPEVEQANDGVALVKLMIPERAEVAAEAALEMVERMELSDPEVVNLQVLRPAEGCSVGVKGHVGFDVDKTELIIPEKIELLPEEELRQFITDHEVIVMADTVDEDEYSVGMREVLDIKRDGLEKHDVKYHYPGTSVPVKKIVNAAIGSGSDAILISTVTNRNEVHRTMMEKFAELTKEHGIHGEKVPIAGGTQVSHDMVAETGLDATFGHGTKGIDVLDAIARITRGREQEKVR